MAAAAATGVKVGNAHVGVWAKVEQGSVMGMANDIADGFDGDAIGRVLGGDISNGIRAGMGSIDITHGVHADDMGAMGEEAGEDFGEGFMGAAAVVGLGAAVYGGLTAAMAKEDGTALLANQLGLTVEESAKYGKVAGEVYAGAYGESQEQVDGVFKDIIGSIKGAREMSADEVGEMAKDVLNLSTTFGKESMEINRAASSMISTGLAKDWDDAMDVLTVGLQQGGTAADDLLDVFGEYSNNFSAMGLDAKESMEIMNSLTSNGISTTDFAADSFREMGLIMRAGAEETGEVLDSIGLNSGEIFAGFQAGGDEAKKAYFSIAEALKSVGDEQKATVLASVFGTQAEDFFGSYDTAFSSAAENTVGKFGDISQAAENVDANFATASAAVTSFQRKALMELTNFAASHLLPVFNDFVTFFGTSVVPALTPVGKIIEGIVGFMIKWKDILGPITVFLTTMFVIVKAVTAAQMIWASVTAAVTAAQVALNVAMTANPIGLITVVILGLVAALVYAWNTNEGFRNSITGAWAAIASAVGGAWTWIQGIFETFVGWLTGTAGPAVGGFFSSIGSGAMAIGAAIGGFFSSIGSSVGGFINGAIDNARLKIEGLLGIFKNIGSFMRDLFGGIGQFIIDGFGNVAGAVKGIMNALVNVINAPIKAINGINVSIPGWVPGVGGKGWSPRIGLIPSFATGGTVMPGPGGRGQISILAEAGRPETVVDTGLHNRRMAKLEMLEKQERNRQTPAESGIKQEFNINGSNLSAGEVMDAAFFRSKLAFV